MPPVDSAAGRSSPTARRPRRRARRSPSLRRPVLAVHAADAAGVRLDPCHGVGARLDAGADVELQRHVLRRPRGQNVHWTLTLHRLPFNGVIVEPGRHPQRLQLLRRGIELVGHPFHPSRPVTCPALAMTMARLPIAWFRSMAFCRRSGVNTSALLCVDRHLMPRSSSSLRTSAAYCGVHAVVRRVELDDLVSQLRDGADRAHQVLHERVAHGVELEPDRHLRRGTGGTSDERQGAGESQEPAAAELEGQGHGEKLSQPPRPAFNRPDANSTVTS